MWADKVDKLGGQTKWADQVGRLGGQTRWADQVGKTDVMEGKLTALTCQGTKRVKSEVINQSLYKHWLAANVYFEVKW